MRATATTAKVSGAAFAVTSMLVMMFISGGGMNDLVVSALSTNNVETVVSRRQSLHALVGGVVTATGLAPVLMNGMSIQPIQPANAVVSDETPRVVTRMGGLLVRLLLLYLVP